MTTINKKIRITNGEYFTNCISQLILIDYLDGETDLPYTIYMMSESMFITNVGSKLDQRLSSLIARIGEEDELYDQYHIKYNENVKFNTTKYVILKAFISQKAIDYINSKNMFEFDICHVRGLLGEKIKQLILYSIEKIKEREKKLRLVISENKIWRNLTDFINLFEDFANPQESTIYNIKHIHKRDDLTNEINADRIKGIAIMIDLNKYYKLFIFYPIELGYALDQMIGAYNNDILIDKLNNISSVSGLKLDFDISFYRSSSIGERHYSVMRDEFILKDSILDDSVKDEMIGSSFNSNSYNPNDLFNIIDTIQSADYKAVVKNRKVWPYNLKLTSFDLSNNSSIERVQRICNRREDIERAIESFRNIVVVKNLPEIDEYGHNPYKSYSPYENINIIDEVLKSYTCSNTNRALDSNYVSNYFMSYMFMYPNYADPIRGHFCGWFFINMVVLSFYYMMSKNLSVIDPIYKMDEKQEAFFNEYFMVNSKKFNKLSLTTFYSKLHKYITDKCDVNDDNSKIVDRRFNLKTIKARMTSLSSSVSVYYSYR